MSAKQFIPKRLAQARNESAGHAMVRLPKAIAAPFLLHLRALARKHQRPQSTLTWHIPGYEELRQTELLRK